MPHDKGPSVYRDGPQGGALHHVCLLTDNIKQARSLLVRGGANILLEGGLDGGGAALYAEAQAGQPLIEVLQPGEHTLAAFASMKAAAADWDRREPLRRMR